MQTKKIKSSTESVEWWKLGISVGGDLMVFSKWDNYDDPVMEQWCSDKDFLRFCVIYFPYRLWAQLVYWYINVRILFSRLRTKVSRWREKRRAKRA